MPQPLIFHVDVNSAFLAWEAQRRCQDGEPDLRLIPSIIAGDQERRHGVVLAKSEPARACGVRTGEPISQAFQKCPNLIVAAPDFRLYKRCSQAFFALCQSYSPKVERYSIDECFLDMTEVQHLYSSAEAAAQELCTAVRQGLGFTVNVGYARNKLLAKMASDFEKPNRVHRLFPEDLPEKFYPLPIGRLLGVGGRTRQRMEQVGLRTIGDVALVDPDWLCQYLGPKQGLLLYERANGHDHSPVRAEPELQKSYSQTRTYAQDVLDWETADSYLQEEAEQLGRRLRRDGMVFRQLQLSCTDYTFTTRQKQCSLPRPSDRTRDIYVAARKLLRLIWDGQQPLRRLGISLGNLRPLRQEQLLLGETEKLDQGRRVDRLLDQLQADFGQAVIGRGMLAGRQERWGLAQALEED